ncbi:transcriptional regulator [Pararhodobacter sp. CCB-MM2]|uniref:transcriptional regulator n=1 Tax=Pararhodobacter sp. CCB-MM2 TaxID=1786003 RepID=UPI00082D64C7|nr:transcriptional regulator [Pararhodobacter sp. CCB-MM2]
MEAERRELSQAEFARDMGVSRAAVSQWKAKDILRDDAFTKPGKTGRVVYHIAVEQVRRNRDVGQSLGNGIGTRTAIYAAGKPRTPTEIAGNLSLPAARSALPRVEAMPQPQALPELDTIEDKLKRAKLEEQLRRNRIQAADEALRRGTLMDAGDAREQMARIAGMMLQIFEGALPDLAASVAARFGVPQRDVLHLLRSDFKKVRASAASKERARATHTDPAAKAEVDLEE